MIDDADVATTLIEAAESAAADVAKTEAAYARAGEQFDKARDAKNVVLAEIAVLEAELSTLASQDQRAWRALIFADCQMSDARDRARSTARRAARAALVDPEATPTAPPAVDQWAKVDAPADVDADR
ncbi:MAG: hypothetical protein IVW52_12860 [Acidimicrobiales bacterium]|nr:hypothetical protein [Acidimicrobiales bacterium]